MHQNYLNIDEEPLQSHSEEPESQPQPDNYLFQIQTPITEYEYSSPQYYPSEQLGADFMIQEDESESEGYFNYDPEYTRSVSTNERSLVTEEFVRQLVDQKMLELEEKQNRRIDELMTGLHERIQDLEHRQFITIKRMEEEQKQKIEVIYEQIQTLQKLFDEKIQRQD